MGSAVGVQREDSGPWMLGRITEHSDNDHNGRSYRTQITMTGRVTTRTARQIKQHQYQYNNT